MRKNNHRAQSKDQPNFNFDELSITASSSNPVIITAESNPTSVDKSIILSDALLKAGFQSSLTRNLSNAEFQFTYLQGNNNTLQPHATELRKAYPNVKEKIEVHLKEYQITRRQALGALSSFKGAINHLENYPSALGFLVHCFNRILEATNAYSGRDFNSKAIAIAFSTDVVREIFEKYAKDTLFESVLHPETTDIPALSYDFEKEAKISYVKAALLGDELPIHPISKAFYKMLLALGETEEKQNALIVLPEPMNLKHAKKLNEELSIVKEIYNRDMKSNDQYSSKITVKTISYLDAKSKFPIPTPIDITDKNSPQKSKKSPSIVLVSQFSARQKAEELHPKRFNGAAVIYLTEEKSWDETRLFV